MTHDLTSCHSLAQAMGQRSLNPKLKMLAEDMCGDQQSPIMLKTVLLFSGCATKYKCQKRAGVDGISAPVHVFMHVYIANHQSPHIHLCGEFYLGILMSTDIY